METDNYNIDFKSELLFAIQETEQILKEYANGARAPKFFANAKEIFAAMDFEDEAEEND